MKIFENDLTLEFSHIIKEMLFSLSQHALVKSWHSTKINKYLALKTAIEYNGWCVELFAVEVGAREYCSKSVYVVLRN